jgi:hypothetical protein
MQGGIPMVFQISGMHQVAAVASGVDKAGHGVQANTTAYVINAGDVNTAIGIAEAQVLNEAVIPDGTGGFTKPTLVTAISVDPINALPIAPLVYWRGPGADQKFSIDSIYGIQVVASSASAGSKTLFVYPLNSILKPSIALAKSDVLTLAILPDPNNPGQMVTPDTVAAISGDPFSSAPLSEFILAASAVIPNWDNAQTVAEGSPNFPSAGSLGLKTSFVIVPNDGTHGAGDVISLKPPAGSTVPIGTLVIVTVWDQSPLSGR